MKMEIRTVAELEWVGDKRGRRSTIARDGRWVTKYLHAVPVGEDGRPFEVAIGGYRWKQYLEPLDGNWEPGQATNCPVCDYALTEFTANQ
jgi:hypothetical protein